MNDANKKILIEVSAFEAAMIAKLREYPFGQFTIHKTQDEPRRIVLGGSEMLRPEQGEKLAIKK
jgi:hypothetical protein